MVGTVVEQYHLTEERRVDGQARYFKAHDSRLDRRVTILVLPVRLTAEHQERNLKFMEEAFIACSTNSPYILPVLAFLSESRSEWVAMEYVRGRTLDRWLQHQRFSRDKAVRYGLHICEALEAAHAAGVAHGDLRPEHVLIAANGPTRVFNFGYHHLIPVVDGRTVGADPRSDIRSLGALLYEMLSGSAPAAQPLLRPIRERVPDLEPKLAEVVDLCLAPDQDGAPAVTLAEVHNALEHWRPMPRIGIPAAATSEPVVEEEAAPVSSITTGETRRSKRRRKRKEHSAPPAFLQRLGSLKKHLGVAATLVAAVGVLAYLVYLFLPSGNAVGISAEAQALTSDPGWTMDPGISADGRKVVYASDRANPGNLDLYLHDLASGKVRRITDSPHDESEPALTPDGSLVVYRSEQDRPGIYAVSTRDGSTPSLIAEGGRKPRVSPKGEVLTYWVSAPDGTSGRGFVVSLAGGVPSQIAPNFTSVEAPIWSPDGTQLMFLGRDRPEGRQELYVTAPWGGAPVSTGLFGQIANPVFRPGRPEAWLALPDRLMFAGIAQGTSAIYQAGIRSANWSITSAPERVSPGLDTEAAPAIAPGGQMVFARATFKIGLWQLPFDHSSAKPSGSIARVNDVGVLALDPAVNREGTHQLMVHNRSGKLDLWSREPVSGAQLHLASTRTRPLHPVGAAGMVWFGLTGPGTLGLYQVPLAGGPVKEVCLGCGTAPWDVTADGKLILLREETVPGPSKVALYDNDAGRSVTVLESERESIFQASWSPDERWIAFSTGPADGSTRLWVTPFLGSKPHPSHNWIALTSGSERDGKVHWSPDGRAVYFLSLRDGNRCIWRLDLDEAKRPAGSPFAVYHGHGIRTALRNVDSREQELAVTRDSMLFNQGEFQGNVWIMNVGRQGRKEDSKR